LSFAFLSAGSLHRRILPDGIDGVPPAGGMPGDILLGRLEMARTIRLDRATCLSALFALVLMAAMVPAAGAAQRRPRLLGTPVQRPADTVVIRSTPATSTTAEEPAASPAAEASELDASSVAGDERAAAIPVTRTIAMRSTAYCLRGTMRTGVRVRDGMAAGDPNVLPLGSVVRVSHTDGRLIGVFVIMDTGGAVRGNKIDLWFESCREASDWGTRSVAVEVLDIGRT
jgi:3D (Asp-Asp-Asp) domain-containing protein